jgi:hypothetical protein
MMENGASGGVLWVGEQQRAADGIMDGDGLPIGTQQEKRSTTPVFVVSVEFFGGYRYPGFW